MLDRRAPVVVALTLTLLTAGLVAGTTSALASSGASARMIAPAEDIPTTTITPTPTPTITPTPTPTPKPTPTPTPTPKPPASNVGKPPSNYVMAPTSYFSFPNRTKGERLAIRNRVLSTIKSVWGGPRSAPGVAKAGNGTIRIATWSFKDMTIARALVAARKRGVSVQVVAAKSANAENAPWRWLKKQLGKKLTYAGRSNTRELVSFARECRGSCRGRGGTAHAKYFLFDNVGRKHVRNVVVQTSMNLTPMGYQGQWNQAYVAWNPTIYKQFLGVHREARAGTKVSSPYRKYNAGAVTSFFFPLTGPSAAKDPVMQILNRTQCLGSTASGTSGARTRIRIIQYSIYGERGTWLAKKLRSLWESGCDISIIYAVSSRPVVNILESTSGRGRIPLRQSVITNEAREIVKYNHSKWMTVVGNWGGSTDAYVTFSGSANWSPFSFTGDEQMQQIMSRTQALRHNATFDKTWRQESSHYPMYGTKAQEARMMSNIPKQPTWGKGIYKYLSPYGG